MVPRSLLSTLLLLGCAPDAPDATSRTLSIIGGTYDPGDSPVAAVLESNGDLICTGTLVTPRALVSAAHCVVLGTPAYVFFGPDPSGDLGQYVNVLDAIPNPDFDLETLDGDVSVIVLDQAAPGFVGEPIPMASAAPTVGMEARMIGYGFTEVGPAGTYARKHQLTVPIDEVMALTFRYGVATCNGDSGGPALVDEGGREVLAGVTSWGDPTCGEYGVDARVDVFRGWIDAVLATITGGPSCDAGDGCLETCDVRDADCPVIPVGETCVNDFNCGAEAVCHESTCRASCDPTAASSCAAGHACVAVDSLVAANLGACVPGEDGCACRAGGRGRPGAWLPLTVLAFLLGRRYDRRRCASARSSSWS